MTGERPSLVWWWTVRTQSVPNCDCSIPDKTASGPLEGVGPREWTCLTPKTPENNPVSGGGSEVRDRRLRSSVSSFLGDTGAGRPF